MWLIWGTNQRHQAHLHHPSHKHRAQILCKLSPVLEAGRGSACHISSGCFIILPYKFRLFNARCTVYIIFSGGRESRLQIWLMPYLVVMFFFAWIKHSFFPCQQNAGIAINGISPLLQTSLAFFPSLGFSTLSSCCITGWVFLFFFASLLSREQTMRKRLLGGRAAKNV